MSCDTPTEIGISSFSDNKLIKAAATTASTKVVDATHYVHFHEVELIRSQSYYFRIFIAGNPITKMIKFEFPTENALSMSASNMTLAIISDNQSGVRWFRTLLSFLSVHEPLLLFHFGDSVQKPFTKEWQFQWFEPLTYVNSVRLTSSIVHQPILAMLRGNHDMGNNLFDLYVHSTLWFGTSVAGVRFVFLHFLPNPAQTKWLMEELNSEEWRKAKLRVAITHIPPFIEYWNPESWNRGEKLWGNEFKEHLLPILLRHSVDVVMGGHSHLYQRGRSKTNNVTYMIVGGGGGELERQNERVANHHIYEATYFGYHYVLMSMTPSEIRFSAYNLTNDLIDQFHVPFGTSY